MSRALLLHASTKWKDGIDSSLWPMAVDYATFIYNNLPNSDGISPNDLFTGSTSPVHRLKDMHVWGCPVYVLDPTLQQGHKLPRWQPKSRKGIFVGFSTQHSSNVPLILNTSTGHISPQYHVVFDDDFSTVASISHSEEPPTFWEELCLDNTHRIEMDNADRYFLDDDWLTSAEREEKRRNLARIDKIRPHISNTTSTLLDAPTSAINNLTTSNNTNTNHSTDNNNNTNSTDNNITPIPSPVPIIDTPQEPRRSARHTKGQFSTTRYINEVYLSSIQSDRTSFQESQLAYLGEIQTDYDTGIVNCEDPRVYAAKLKKLHDPDTPTWHEAMNGSDADHYVEAMKKEVSQLIKINTWKTISRNAVPKDKNGKDRTILKGTWAFKLKRLPDGTPSKYKARYCCRGDLQTHGVDYFETFAPVISWSTIRLLLTLTLSKNWTTRQVDYTNAFAQADIQEEVYLEPPRGFQPKNNHDSVLHLQKSLYGLKQAPKTFYEKLSCGLIERGFHQSNLDPCLFLKRNMICVIYVDDTILAGPDGDELEKEIAGLGVSSNEQQHKFELRNEGEVGDFLGIRIEKMGDQHFLLSQPGLINKVLKEAVMQDASTAPTPAVVQSLGKDELGESFDETWEYASVVGMLLYLSGNSRLDIAYAVNQCARFTHNPKTSHATAIKRILRYLKGTADQGLNLKPKSNYKVDCYVDADFEGLWGSENHQDPISVKSRSGYLITFMECPIVWSSKL